MTIINSIIVKPKNLVRLSMATVSLYLLSPTILYQLDAALLVKVPAHSFRAFSQGGYSLFSTSMKDPAENRSGPY